MHVIFCLHVTEFSGFLHMIYYLLFTANLIGVDTNLAWFDVVRNVLRYASYKKLQIGNGLFFFKKLISLFFKKKFQNFKAIRNNRYPHIRNLRITIENTNDKFDELY